MAKRERKWRIHKDESVKVRREKWKKKRINVKWEKLWQMARKLIDYNLHWTIYNDISNSSLMGDVQHFWSMTVLDASEHYKLPSTPIKTYFTSLNLFEMFWNFKDLFKIEKISCRQMIFDKTTSIKVMNFYRKFIT